MNTSSLCYTPSDDCSYDFANARELVEHCHDVAEYFLERLEEWRPHIGDLNCTGDDADVDVLRREYLLTLGPITSSLRNVPDDATSLTAAFVEQVTTSLLKAVNEYRSYLTSWLKLHYISDFDGGTDIILPKRGKEFTMATEDIVMASLIIDLLRHARDAVGGDNHTGGRYSKEALLSAT